MCKVHKTKILGFYCVSCCTLVCSNCFSIDEEHFQHHLKEIGEAEEYIDERINTKIKELIETKKDFIKSLEILNEERLFLENEFESLLQEHKKKEEETKLMIDFISSFEKEFIFNKKNRCEFFINEKQKIFEKIKSLSKTPEYKLHINNLKNEIENNFKVEQLLNDKMSHSQKFNQDQILFYNSDDKKIYTFDLIKKQKALLFDPIINIDVIKVLSDQTIILTTRQTLYHFDSKGKKLFQRIFKDNIKGVLEVGSDIILVYSSKYLTKYDLKKREVLYEEVEGNIVKINKRNNGYIFILDHEIKLTDDSFDAFDQIKELDVHECIEMKNRKYITLNVSEIKIWNKLKEITRINRYYFRYLLELKSGNILCYIGNLISILSPNGDLLNDLKIPFISEKIIELEDGNILTMSNDGIYKISGFQ